MPENYWSQENIVGIGAGIGSSPKLIDGKIVFGAFDSFVYALEPKKGEIIWKFKTNDAVYTTASHSENLIFIGSQDGFLYALDFSGNLKWKTHLNERIVGTSPVFSNNVVYTGNDKGVFFSVNSDGTVKWKYLTGSAIRVTPSLVSDKVIFGSHDHNLYLLNTKGEKLWKFQTGGPLWTYPCIIDSNYKILWSLSRQELNEANKFYVYFGSFDGGLYCLDQDGKLKWRYITGGPNASGPEYKDGKIYFGSTDGYFYCIDSVTSDLIWKFKTIGQIGHSCPVFYNNKIYIGDYVYNKGQTGGNIYCIDENGSMLWRFSADNAVVSTPLIHDDVLYFGSYDGFLYAISLKTQNLLWKFRTLYEKINFDIGKAVMHLEYEEKKARNIFAIWKPELNKQKENKLTTTYTQSNTTIYGAAEDAQRFSYSAGEAYKRKASYKNSDSPYKN